MRPQDIIAKKRDGGRLAKREIDEFVRGVTDGTWPDYQITALIMAMFLNELDFDEQSLITHAMLHSGEILDLSEIDLPKADKHSTGGVGDKTSLIIAPLAAACGLAVPMISGRGLGHTGGTLDKLESIRGYNVNLATDEFRKIISKCGFAMSGQTDDIAPADRKIYALRDATATVPTIPLIVASIMSKKLAEGLDALVLDVKTGNGAFMRERDSSARLAREMVNTGTAFGLRTRALITDMSQPLGKYVGNALEVYESVLVLRGEGEDSMLRTRRLSMELTAHMLVLADITKTKDDGIKMAEAALSGGQALERFRMNVEIQGGDPAICDYPELLKSDGLAYAEVRADRSGFVEKIDTEELGYIVSSIGGGRIRADDKIDHAVGFSAEAPLGGPVKAGDLLGTIFARSAADAEIAGERVRMVYTIGEKQEELSELVVEVIKSS